MINICFLAEFPLGIWQWADGLRGAMEILSEEQQVHYHFDGKIKEDCFPDVVMAWGGTMSNPFRYAQDLNAKRILFFAGGGIEKDYFKAYDMVLFENQSHTDFARSLGVRCMTAFGTNTKVFYPMKQPKIFDVIYPGAFGLWKRKDLFAEAVKGLTAFSVGNIQEHEPECLQVCIDNDIAVSADIPQNRLPYFMAMSKSVVVLPVAEIGCQRTVLEAMAMKIPVIVPTDAPLVLEFAQNGGIITEPDPVAIRTGITVVAPTHDTQPAYDYVMSYMTEKHYANKIKTALSAIL